MKRSSDAPKTLSQLIDHLDQIREELLVIQRRMEELEKPKAGDGEAKFDDGRR